MNAVRRRRTILALLALAAGVLVLVLRSQVPSDEPVEDRRRPYAKTAHPLLDAIYEYRAAHGRWPSNAADIISQSPGLRRAYAAGRFFGRWEYVGGVNARGFCVTDGTWRQQSGEPCLTYSVCEWERGLWIRGEDFPEYVPKAVEFSP